MSHVIGLVLSHVEQDQALVQSSLPKLAAERVHDGTEADKLLDEYVELLARRDALASTLLANFRTLYQAPPEDPSNVLTFAQRVRRSV